MVFLITSGALAAFLIWWCFIMWVAATLCGWSRLAARYRSSSERLVNMTRFRWQSISMGLGNYGNCVTIGVDKGGVYLACSPKFMFPFHPAVFLPWSELEVLRVREGWLVRDVVLHVGHPATARIHLPLRVLEAAEKLKAAA